VNYSQSFQKPLVYKIGKIKEDRYWIERPDGLLLQIDNYSKKLLEQLANKEPISSIADKMEVSEKEILLFLEKLGIDKDAAFSLIEEKQSDFEPYQKPLITYYNPWLERKWFNWITAGAVLISIISTVLFMINTPFFLVTDLKGQWIIAGVLTFSVLIHELGHLLTMPRTGNISISVQWSGPVPLFSIVCNEAWKLSKWQRMRINIAGFTADLIVCGLTSVIGLCFAQLSPWIWSFLIVHMFRMLFAIFPLLPGDGYWMIVDLLNQPNLWKNAIDQLKKLKINWLSFYAFVRIAFHIFIWILYTYFIFLWSAIIFTRPFEDVLLFFLQPAPLLLFLNLFYQLIFITSIGIKHIRRLGKAERALER